MENPKLVLNMAMKKITKVAKISSLRPKRERVCLVFFLSQGKDKYLIARSPACASHVSAKLELSFS